MGGKGIMTGGCAEPAGGQTETRLVMWSSEGPGSARRAPATCGGIRGGYCRGPGGARPELAPSCGGSSEDAGDIVDVESQAMCTQQPPWYYF